MLMRRFWHTTVILILISAIVLPLGSCQSKTKDPEKTPAQEKIMYSSESLLTIIPTPKEVKLVGDKSNYVIYDLSPKISTTDDEFAKYINTFTEYTAKIIDVTLENEVGGIELKRDTSLSAGQYHIVCDQNGICVTASDNDGMTYALATLLQIIQCQNGKLTVPSYTITDQPDCSYRALMVDLARKWHTLVQVKDYVDLCYLYKIKFIHLHFTDNESYTLPSDAFPKLSTNSRSYTKQDIAELNQYCLERNIEIIPEIDMPGHATPFTEAYPELFKHTVTQGSANGRVLCVGKAGLTDNLKTLITELIEMFPNSRYIHVGGDEADFSHCNTCADCQKYMADIGISDTKALYTKFVKDVTDTVLSLGKTPVVWEGFPKEGAEDISRDIVVTGWESLYHLPNDLIDEGFTVTNSSWKPLYIVPPTHPDVQGGRWQPLHILLEWNIYTWRNWWSASAAYANPITVEPTDQVIGGTLCAWECTYEEDITPVKENLAAVSERLWNVKSVINPTLYMKALRNLWDMADKVINAEK